MNGASESQEASESGEPINVSSRGPTPWRKIATSTPFLTLLFVHCANNWGYWTLLTEMPTYMKNILDIDIKSNGPLSALPYLVMCLLSYCFVCIANVLRVRNAIPLRISRKLFNTIGQWLPMAALVALGSITMSSHSKLAIALLTIAVGSNAATYLGFQVNHIDLAPHYAGTLMGITNCAANVMSILAPLSVGYIVNDETNADQWRTVFFISAAFYFFGNLMFLLYGRTNVQSWNYANHSHTNDDTADRNQQTMS